MSTLSQLITEVSTLTGDTAGNRWLTAVANPPVLGTNDIQYLLNLAAIEFNALTGVYRKTISVQAQQGNPIVSLLDEDGSPPFGALLRLEDKNGVALIMRKSGWLDVTTQDAAWMNAPPGKPKSYLRGIEGFATVRLFPPPDENMPLKAYVVAEPVPMLRSTDLPWIGNGTNRQDSPAHYHGALSFWAAAYCLSMNRVSRDLAGVAMFYQEFDRRAQRAAAEVKAAMEG